MFSYSGCFLNKFTSKFNESWNIDRTQVVDYLWRVIFGSVPKWPLSGELCVLGLKMCSMRFQTNCSMEFHESWHIITT